jgi:transposase
MSLCPNGFTEIPAETSRVAGAAFPNRCLVIWVRDALGAWFTDEQFSELFAARGRPAWSPARLALVLVLQFVEGLTDRQAADAVRARLDWKYALGLDLDDPGFDASVLSEFRARLLADGQAERLLGLLLDRLRERDLLGKGGRQRTDATHVRMAVGDLHRLGQVIETPRAALEAMAVVAPAWLDKLIPPEWTRRYASAATTGGCPRPNRPAPSGPLRLAGTAWCCWRRSMARRRRQGWPAWRRCRSCGRPGSSSATSTAARCAGATSTAACRPAAGSSSTLRPRRPTRRQTRPRLARRQGHVTETCEPDRPT